MSHCMVVDECFMLISGFLVDCSIAKKGVHFTTCVYKIIIIYTYFNKCLIYLSIDLSIYSVFTEPEGQRKVNIHVAIL